jgi:hypothetical protein
MLVVRPKISELTFRVFGRSLHPELFHVCASRQIRRSGYAARIDITSSGHIVTFSADRLVLCEVAAAQHQLVPQQRQMLSLPLVGSHRESLETGGVIGYECEFREDTAHPQRLAELHRELRGPAENEGLAYHFQPSGRMAFGAVSFVYFQSRIRTLRVQVFHTFPDSCRIITTSSRFCLLAPKSPPDERTLPSG